MRNHIFAVLTASLLLLMSADGFCQDSESALGDPPPVSFKDPSLANSHHFSPASATSGVANMGLALGSPNTHGGAKCSAENPCAVPSPALDHIPIRTP
jgi:hypothetical protein